MTQTDKTAHEYALANAPISSLFTRYAIPSVIGMLSVAMQSIIDGLVVGNFLGANALAGVSLVLPLFSFVTALTIIIGIGSQTLESVGQGEGNYNKVRNAMTTGLLATLVIAALVSATVLIWSKEVVYLLGGSAVLEPYAIGYINGLIPFLIPIGCAFYNDFILRGMGNPRVSMSLTSLSVVLNILLNLFFVLVCEWGTFGVGFATGLSLTVSAILSTYLLQFKSATIKLLSGKFKPRLLWHIVYNGSSEGVSELAVAISVFLFNITLMKYLGEAGVAAFTVINYIYFAGVITLIGVSDGLIPVISYNFGAKRYDRSKAVFKLALLVNGVIGVSIAIVLTFFSPFIIEAFLDNKDQEVIQIALQGAKIYALAFLLNGFNILSASFFTAITDAKRSVIISALRGIAFVAIGIITIPIAFGIEYVWYAIPVSELLTLCVSIALIYQLFKKWEREALAN